MSKLTQIDSNPNPADLPAPLSHKVSAWRWQAPLLALLLVLTHQLLEHTWLQYLSRWQHFASQMFFYGLVGPLLTWWMLTVLLRSVRQTEQAHVDLAQANQRLALLMHVNRRLDEADDEEQLVSAILELPQAVAPVLGASLVRFDEAQRPLPVVFRGEMDPALIERLANRLATPAVRHACQTCTVHQADTSESCPLLATTGDDLSAATDAAIQVFCLPLVRGSREYGMLNLYLDANTRLTDREGELLAAMTGEMSLALESHHLRSRELAALYRLRQTRQTSNLHAGLAAVLADTVDALEIDGGLLYLVDEQGSLQAVARTGPALGARQDLVLGLAAGVLTAREPVIIGDLSLGKDAAPPRAILVAPLHVEDKIIGCLVLWAGQKELFNQRHMRLAATVAGQAALLVDNHALYQRAEHHAGLAERARLAREIHDGLAQSLAYLKLRTAQIGNWLRAGEIDRAGDALEQVRALIAAAYVDAREAIDGLRLQPGAGAINDWLIPLLDDFHSLCDVEITTSSPPALTLPPEVHVQLLRIVQEALGNVRKHSGATQARLEWQADGSWLLLHIIDNGHGFDPDDVPLLSRHGLRIMQERAELLDADFQIASRPGAGTQVIVRAPVGQAVRQDNGEKSGD